MACLEMMGSVHVCFQAEDGIRDLIVTGVQTCALTISRAEDGIRDLIVRSEEHTSELQSRSDLVCRLLLEKKDETCALPISRSDFVCHLLLETKKQIYNTLASRASSCPRYVQGQHINRCT